MMDLITILLCSTWARSVGMIFCWPYTQRVAATPKPYSGFNSLATGEWLSKGHLFVPLQQQYKHTSHWEIISSRVFRAAETCVVTEGQVCRCEGKGKLALKPLWHLFLCSAQDRVAWQRAGRVLVLLWEMQGNESVMQLTNLQCRCTACKLRRLDLLETFTESLGPSLVSVTLWHLLYLSSCHLSLVRKYHGS